ncbi:hypothetical protein DRO50_03240 [Candidatus Bathyarchaeota archaeon]|nr:MAG: hypothetical protein DRO50_03240 [Candidatus Bathyarchaeota archaeon]
MAYMVILCYRCGRALIAKAGCKTRLCPYCGARVALEKAKKLASASSADEAAEKLRAFNERKRKL